MIIFFDGECNLCDGAVRFLLDRDADGVFRFASLQSGFATRFFAEHGWDSAGLDSIVVYEDEEFLVHSDAVIRIAEKLPGIWRAGAWLRVLPKPQRDALYRLVAQHRYRIFGRRNACRVPTPAEAARFLG